TEKAASADSQRQPCRPRCSEERAVGEKVAVADVHAAGDAGAQEDEGGEAGGGVGEGEGNEVRIPLVEPAPAEPGEEGHRGQEGVGNVDQGEEAGRDQEGGAASEAFSASRKTTVCRMNCCTSAHTTSRPNQRIMLSCRWTVPSSQPTARRRSTAGSVIPRAHRSPGARAWRWKPHGPPSRRLSQAQKARAARIARAPMPCATPTRGTTTHR